MGGKKSEHCYNAVAMKRWICFIVAVWLQSINGTNSVFSDYSSDLKKVMGINQIKLNSLAVASDLGKIMGWVSGVGCMLLPTWAVLGIAMSLGIVGYGVQWLMMTQIIPPLAFWQVYMLCFLAGNSICWFNTVSFRAAIENFPSNRGIASGLSTSYSGLSAVIYTCFSSIMSKGQSSSYLLLNFLVPSIVAIISAILLHVCESKKANEEEKVDKKNMILFTLIAITTAVCSILYEFLPLRNTEGQGIYMSVLFMLLLVPLYIPLKSAFGHTTKTKKVINYNSSPRKSPRTSLEIKGGNGTKSTDEEKSEKNSKLIAETTNSHTIIDIDTQKKAKKKSVPLLGEEHGIMDLLASLDFWLYYFVYFCGGTVGLVYINNLGQILQSLGYTKNLILVSLVSSFGFFGRIASGIPDYIQQWRLTKDWRPIPRPAWIGIWMVPMAVAFFMMALLNPRSMGVLYVSTAIVGLSSGAITTIAIPVSSELFGLEHFGVNHNILITNIALGSILFGEIAGVIYDKSSSTQGIEAGGRLLCVGRQCYGKTFLLWGGVCSFGVLLCVILCVRTRELYISMHRQSQNQN
ncbi:hypothetical protein SUGI_0126720 [Cryptomeria japonica]|nr:hypothetical protein SUGI_0126720 [Cryptomeria japonica]